MIFRAMVQAYPQDRPALHQDERVVFLDAGNRDEARLAIPGLISSLWQVPVESITIFNLEAEFDLQNSPYAQGLTRDQALFGVGFGSKEGPSFVRREIGHPLFLTRTSLDRLTQAYIELCTRPAQ